MSSTPEEQDALKVIALSEPVPRRLIEDVCGAGVVRSLLDNQVVAESAATQSELRLAYAILGESTRRQVSVSRSLQLRQKLDAHLAAAGASAEGRLRLVEWSLECGLEVPDLDLLNAGLLTLIVHGSPRRSGRVCIAAEISDHEVGFVERKLRQPIGSPGRSSERKTGFGVDVHLDAAFFREAED